MIYVLCLFWNTHTNCRAGRMNFYFGTLNYTTEQRTLLLTVNMCGYLKLLSTTGFIFFTFCHAIKVSTSCPLVGFKSTGVEHSRFCKINPSKTRFKSKIYKYVSNFFQCWQWNRHGNGYQVQSQHYLSGIHSMECLSQISHSMRREFIKVGQFFKIIFWHVTEKNINLNFTDNTESMWGVNFVLQTIIFLFQISFWYTRVQHRIYFCFAWKFGFHTKNQIRVNLQHS